MLEITRGNQTNIYLANNISLIDLTTDTILGNGTKFLQKDYRKNTKGYLIALEGVEGAGKSTVMTKLQEYYELYNYEVLTTTWGSSKRFHKAIDKIKDNKEACPMVYALMYMADMMYRLKWEIIPALEENKIVICDRYCYTSKVRDKLRGINTEIDYIVYDEVPEPDVLFHCVSPLDVCFQRLKEEGGLSWYGSGMDIGYSDDIEESAKIYIKKENELYKEVLDGEEGYYKLNTNQPAHDTLKEAVQAIKKMVKLEV